jgi:hypothetical protein
MNIQPPKRIKRPGVQQVSKPSDAVGHRPTLINTTKPSKQLVKEGKKKKRYLDNSESQRKRERKRVWRVTIMAMLYVLLGKHILHLLVGEVDLVYGISSILQRDVVAVDVGGEKDF